MIKTGLIKVKSIENEETIMTIIKITITAVMTVIMKIIMVIRMTMRIKTTNYMKIQKS